MSDRSPQTNWVLWKLREKKSVWNGNCVQQRKLLDNTPRSIISVRSMLSKHVYKYNTTPNILSTTSKYFRNGRIKSNTCRNQQITSPTLHWHLNLLHKKSTGARLHLSLMIIDHSSGQTDKRCSYNSWDSEWHSQRVWTSWWIQSIHVHVHHQPFPLG